MMHEINNREKRKVIYLTTVVIYLFVKIVGFFCETYFFCEKRRNLYNRFSFFQ